MRMVSPYLQLIAGTSLLFLGAAYYVRDGSWSGLTLLVIGAASLVTGAVVIGVRQVIREEWNRQEQKSKPVLQI